MSCLRRINATATTPFPLQMLYRGHISVKKLSTRLVLSPRIGVLTQTSEWRRESLFHTTTASDMGKQSNKKADPSGYRKNPSPKAPYLKDVLRQFQMKVHPDFFGKHPELQQKNNENLQVLMGVLSSVKSGEKTELVEPQKHDLEFFLRTGQEDHFKRVPLKLDLKGGNSKHVLGRQLSTLFYHAGLPTEFKWGDEYWNIKLVQENRPTEEEE